MIRYLFLFLFVASTSAAQQRERLVDGWEFVRQDLGGVWEAVRPAAPGSPESLPFWEKVKLPHCVNALDAVDPDVHYYQGPSWYRTRLVIENPYANGRTLLHFEGAGQKTQVFVHLTKVGDHVGGYDEWTVDITEAVKAFRNSAAYQNDFKGKIPISIRVDNSRDVEMIPSDLSDFNLYGGIYRYLNLVYVPKVSIDKLFISPTIDRESKNGVVKLRTSFLSQDSTQRGSLSVSVRDGRGKVIGKKEYGNISFSGNQPLEALKIRNPMLWSDSVPSLYTMVIEGKSDDGTVFMHQERFGFREFGFQVRGPFMLNGKRLLLRGTHRHEDHAGVGAAMTEDMIRREMVMMKEMGVNFIRLGHYQQSRIVLELCDSLGILVWEEIPWCRGGLGSQTYQLQARRMLTNMIEQHFNHPSIIIWGLGNENDWPGDFPVFDKEKIRKFMAELNDLSHALDPSRKTAIRRCDFCRDIVDVYSPSIWAGWYRGAYTDYKAVSEAERDQVRHFLHVEWGGDSHARRHSENPDAVLRDIVIGRGADERAGDASLFGGPARVSKDGDWSESYICNLIDWHLMEQQSMPWLSGTAYWPFKDFSTPIRPENPVPYVNQKGVVERDFTKKESYYVFQSWWTRKPMIHIYGHSWPTRWGKAGEEKMVKVYSNCVEVELWLNGKSFGKRKRNPQDFPASGLRWMLPLQEGVNVISVSGKSGSTTVTDEVEFTYHTKGWSSPQALELRTVKETADSVTVEVSLHDKDGNICLDARQFVRFDLIGAGMLIDNQGTSTGSRYVQLYNGRAMITSRKRDGPSVISAQCEDLPAVFLNVR